ncbi:MAG: complex I subunit 5 family protein [Kiloniellales bacterium]
MGASLDAWLLLLIPSAPLAVACGLLLWPSRRALTLLAPWAALPALLCSFGLTAPLEIDLPWLLLGTQLVIDHTARIFLFFTAFLWLAAGVFATGYLQEEDGRARFFVFFLLAMAGNLGLIIAGDMLSFYASFAMMSFASYGLILHNRTAEAGRAGRIYIVMVVAGEVMLFAALVLAATVAGSLLFADVPAALAEAPTRDLILALALAGFGIKLGVVGLHVWLPLAHPVAPTPASAVLSGAMIKAGLLGWLRLLPLGESAAFAGWGAMLMGVGLLAVFYAALVGVAQRNPKTVLAYSSVSQMGLVTTAIGLGLAVPARWPEISAIVLFLALHHALAKGALFLGVGVAASRFAAGRYRWLVATGLVVPALALAGAPFTSGGLVKELLKPEAMALSAPWGALLASLLAWTLVATVLLMARFLYLAWPAASSVDASSAGASSGYSLSVPWAVLIAALLLSAFGSGLDGADEVWTWSTTLSGFGTLALTAACTALGGWLLARIDWRRIPLPASGDLVVPAEMVVAFVVRASYRSVHDLGDRLSRGVAPAKPYLGKLKRLLAPAEIVEGAWAPACAMFLALLLILAAISAT